MIAVTKKEGVFMSHPERRKPEDFSRSTCRKTIWQIYHLAPTASWFSLQILDRSAGTVLHSLEFPKNDEERRIDGERRLYQLIGDIYARYQLENYAALSQITCEFRYGFGCDYAIKMYVNS